MKKQMQMKNLYKELIIGEYSLADEKEVIDLWVKCGLVKLWNNPKQDMGRKLKVDSDLFLVGILTTKLF